jgi:tetratricopeptide (TPR) repeat protein
VRAQEDFARARANTADRTRQVALQLREGAAWFRQAQYRRAAAAYQDVLEQTKDVEVPATTRAEAELGLTEVHYASGDLAAAAAAMQRAVEIARTQSPTVVTIRILGLAAWTHAVTSYFQGDYITSEGSARRMLDLYQSIDDPQGIGRAWYGLALTARRHLRLPEAEGHARTALDILQRIGDQEYIGGSWWALAQVQQAQGHLAAAEASFQTSTRIIASHPFALALAHDGLGEVACASGELTRAEEQFQRSLALRREIGDLTNIGRSLAGLGLVACERGDLAAAARWYRQARRADRAIGAHAMEAADLLGQARSCLRGQRSRSRLRVVATLLARASALIEAHRLDDLVVDSALLTAQLRLHEGTVAEATRLAEVAMQHAHTQGRRLHEALARRVLGQCTHASGLPAAPALQAALQLQEEVGARLEAARTRLLLAAALRAETTQEGLLREADSLRAAARGQFAACGALLDLEQADAGEQGVHR